MRLFIVLLPCPLGGKGLGADVTSGRDTPANGLALMVSFHSNEPPSCVIRMLMNLKTIRMTIPEM